MLGISLAAALAALLALAPSPAEALADDTVAIVAPGLPWPQGLQGHDDENWPTQLYSVSSERSERNKRKSQASLKLETNTGIVRRPGSTSS